MEDEPFESAIDACLDCARECMRCEDSCGGHHDFLACQRACREVFNACVFSIADIRDESHHAPITCLGCAIACEDCADECDKHSGRPFRRCAEACRRCARACRRIAATRPSRMRPKFPSSSMGLH